MHKYASNGERMIWPFGIIEAIGIVRRMIMKLLERVTEFVHSEKHRIWMWRVGVEENH
jgi:hypothetical protein